MHDHVSGCMKPQDHNSEKSAYNEQRGARVQSQDNRAGEPDMQPYGGFNQLHASDACRRGKDAHPVGLKESEARWTAHTHHTTWTLDGQRGLLKRPCTTPASSLPMDRILHSSSPNSTLRAGFLSSPHTSRLCINANTRE